MYQQLIDQLAYHADELTALQPALALLPSQLIESSPDVAQKSILECLKEGAQTEIERLGKLSIQNVEMPSADGTWQQFVDQWAEARMAIVQHIKGWSDEEFESQMDGVSTHAVLESFVHDDTDLLRQIAERIHYSGWGMRS